VVFDDERAVSDAGTVLALQIIDQVKERLPIGKREEGTWIPSMLAA
jgi:hypothetical protein